MWFKQTDTQGIAKRLIPQLRPHYPLQIIWGTRFGSVPLCPHLSYPLDLGYLCHAYYRLLSVSYSGLGIAHFSGKEVFVSNRSPTPVTSLTPLSTRAFISSSVCERLP